MIFDQVWAYFILAKLFYGNTKRQRFDCYVNYLTCPKGKQMLNINRKYVLYSNKSWVLNKVFIKLEMNYQSFVRTGYSKAGVWKRGWCYFTHHAIVIMVILPGMLWLPNHDVLIISRTSHRHVMRGGGWRNKAPQTIRHRWPVYKSLQSHRLHLISRINPYDAEIFW